MEVQERNGVRIYGLTSGTALPPWLGERARRNLSKRDPSLRRRVELLQDFDMPSSSSKVRQSPNGRYLLALGTYKPRVRCYDVDQLGMKFERYLDAEAVDVAFLGEDYGKFAVLLGDRSVSFHAPYGSHASVRIPSFGRALGYEWSTCDLFVPSSSGETYRFNLELGKFQQSLGGADGNRAEARGGGTCIAMSSTHRLAAVGHEDGLLRFYDARTPSRRPLVRLDVAAATANHGFHGEDDHGGGYGGRIPGELSSVSFDPSGVYLACGTRGGCVPLYDVRSARPLHVKEHQYGLPVHSVQFHRSRGGGGGGGGNCVMSADAKLVKIWSMDASYSANDDRHDVDGGGIIGANDNTSGGSVGQIVANIEGSADIAHFIVAGDEADPSGSRSGLVLCASESPRMQTFYCPVLGAAPRWCSFLDSITEELEEGDLNDPSSSADPTKSSESAASSAVYQDFKFVTRDELETLGVSNLIGTPLLRGYMHGFFMDTALYSKVRAVAKPFEYEEYRKDKVRKRIEERRSSRIAPRKSDRKKDKPRVNAELAERLRDKAGGEDGDGGDGKRKKKGSAAEKAVARTVLADDRFASLFDDPDYQIDEGDENFRLRHASGLSKNKTKQGSDDEDDYSEDMDSDRDEDYDETGGDEGAAFDRVADGAGERDEDELESDESDGSHGDDSDDEDGFAGARVRGENYAATRGSNQLKGRKGRSATSTAIIGSGEKRKSKGDRGKVRTKHVLYEADDYSDGDDRNAALGIGLGMPGAHVEAKRRKNEASMPLEERIRLREEVEEEERSSRLRGHEPSGRGEFASYEKGSSRQITYIPKDSKKNKTELEGEGRGSQGAKRRQRRSIKDLGRK